MNTINIVKFISSFNFSKNWFYFLIKLLISAFVFIFIVNFFVNHKEVLNNYLHASIFRDYYIIFIYIWLSILWFLIFYLISFICSKISFWWKSRAYYFDSTHWPNKFIFQGNIHLKSNKLVITKSGIGCLLKDRSWKNFNAEIKFDAVKNNFGFVFRASDLDNYMMIQFRIANGNIKIVPHIRVYGFWEKYSRDSEIPFSISEVHTLQIKAVDSKVTVYFDNNIFDSFYLPTHHSIEFKKSGENNGDVDPLNRIGANKIYFRKASGNIGFRCWNGEKVEILSFEVLPIRWWSK